MILKRLGLICTVLALTALVAVTGCSNTLKGAGQDIEKAGESLQRAAQ